MKRAIRAMIYVSTKWICQQGVRQMVCGGRISRRTSATRSPLKLQLPQRLFIGGTNHSLEYPKFKLFYGFKDGDLEFTVTMLPQDGELSPFINLWIQKLLVGWEWLRAGVEDERWNIRKHVVKDKAKVVVWTMVIVEYMRLPKLPTFSLWRILIVL